MSCIRSRLVREKETYKVVWIEPVISKNRENSHGNSRCRSDYERSG